MVRKISVRTRGQGLSEITRQIERIVEESGTADGICHVFIQHTSASLIIQENADPSAQYDLEKWINRLVPEDDPHYTHVFEGRDDMPSHIKSVLTSTSLSIPVQNGRLALGTWQGVYLWEHRSSPHSRTVVIHVGQ